VPGLLERQEVQGLLLEQVRKLRTPSHPSSFMFMFIIFINNVP